jgi:hypothetical protein
MRAMPFAPALPYDSASVVWSWRAAAQALTLSVSTSAANFGSMAEVVAAPGATAEAAEGGLPVYGGRPFAAAAPALANSGLSACRHVAVLRHTASVDASVLSVRSEKGFNGALAAALCRRLLRFAFADRLIDPNCAGSTGLPSTRVHAFGMVPQAPSAKIIPSQQQARMAAGILAPRTGSPK